jgi:hypothetical protein
MCCACFAAQGQAREGIRLRGQSAIVNQESENDSSGCGMNFWRRRSVFFVEQWGELGNENNRMVKEEMDMVEGEE